MTSEAEEEVVEQAVEGIAVEEENDGVVEEEDVEQDGGIKAEEEQILVNLHGYWVK
jgi:hypothetical protein